MSFNSSVQDAEFGAFPGARTRPRARQFDRASRAVRLLPRVEPDLPAIDTDDQLRRMALQAGDGLAILLAIVVAIGLTPIDWQPEGVGAGLLVTFVCVRLFGLHDRDTLVLRRSTLDEVPRLLEISALVACAYWLALPEGPGRLPLLVLFVLLGSATTGVRAANRWAFRAVGGPERCLYIGDMAVAELVRDKVAASRSAAVVIGAIPLGTWGTADSFGGVDGLRTIVAEARVSRVILAPMSVSASDTLELIRVAKEVGVRVSVFPRFLAVVGTTIEYEELEGLTFLGVRRFGLTPGARSLKRAFDLLGASLALLLAAPAVAAIALAIKLDSRGPVLFRQTRVGRDGRRFQILKFRTMCHDAEALKADLRDANETDGLFKIAADPRVTRVGRLLRATSLDELPQLINVLRGEMSLVGPRPLVIEEDAQVLGLGRRRLHLTPGMTGPWQIMRSGRVPMHEMVSIDYLYVATWSLWTDVKVLLRTVAYVASRGGV